MNFDIIIIYIKPFQTTNSKFNIYKPKPSKRSGIFVISTLNN